MIWRKGWIHLNFSICPGAFHPILQSSWCNSSYSNWCKIARAARNSVPQTAVMTFAVSSVFILLLISWHWYFNPPVGACLKVSTKVLLYRTRNPQVLNAFILCVYTVQYIFHSVYCISSKYTVVKVAGIKEDFLSHFSATWNVLFQCFVKNKAKFFYVRKHLIKYNIVSQIFC